MIKHIFILLSVLFLFRLSPAQEETTIDEVITFHPFHLVNNGIRIDYDRRIFNNHWLQFGPQFYASERAENRDSRDYKELLGVGVSLYHRIYVGERKPSMGTYFSYGLTYSHFDLKYDEETPVAGNLLAETKINKFGGDIIIGYQTLAFDKLIVDIYAGLGSRYADRRYMGKTQRKFNKYIYDYGYTGNLLIAGIRIGFGF